MEKILYKYLVLIVLFGFYGRTEAQQYVTNSPDSVCAGAQNVVYRIPPPAGVSPTVYNWSISGGGTMNVLAAPVNDSIFVNWGNTAGVDTVRVFQSNGGTCVGPVARLPVVRYIPTAAIAGPTATICSGSGINGNYTITFTGRGPYSVTYRFVSGSDVLGPYTVNGITGNSYVINIPSVANAGTYTAEIVSATDKSCPIINISGAPVLNVISQPPLPVIQHID